jgi:hypothetical protein
MSAERKTSTLPRATTINIARESASYVAKERDQNPYPDDVQRPVTRADCVDAPRPCPFVSCRHHLALDIGKKGNIKVNFPELELHELPATCVLDIASLGGATLDDCASMMNITRERLRQLEHGALDRIRKRKHLLQMCEEA